MKYYKVVRSCKGKDPVSFMAKNCELVSYPPQKWVQARPQSAKLGYGLFVFNSLESPKKAVDCYLGQPCEIWEVNVRGVHKSLPLFVDYLCFTWKSFENMLLTTKQIHDKVNAHSPVTVYQYVFPPGTVMVDKVKLVRRVHPK